MAHFGYWERILKNPSSVFMEAGMWVSLGVLFVQQMLKVYCNLIYWLLIFFMIKPIHLTCIIILMRQTSPFQLNRVQEKKLICTILFQENLSTVMFHLLPG